MAKQCLPRVIVNVVVLAARHFVYVLRDELQWRPITKQRYAADFTARNDPWGYEVNAFEAEKSQAALELLNVARNGALFARGWEIGCAEGVFTARLARLCAQLCAADYNPTGAR